MSIKITGDGSHTIHSPIFDVPYHSIHGALQETNHVFIQEGLNFIQKPNTSLNILEVGFGTGLNAIATLKAIHKQTVQIAYHTLEAYPIDMSTFEQLNFASFFEPQFYNHLKEMHLLTWSDSHTITQSFTFHKHKIRLEDYKSTDQIDLIYFDAFAPTAQPELWEPLIFQKLFDQLNSGGILVTYCAKGQFKRDLKSVGFIVENPPGPPRKREMTRAIKP